MTAHFDEALKLALHKISAKDLFENEIRDLLRAEDPGTVDQVVKWLKDHGCLNEMRTAEVAIKRREGKRAAAFAQIEEQLLKRGASPDIVKALRPKVSESETAHSLLCARYKPLLKDRAKAARFLCSRGFETEVVTKAIEEFFGEQTEDGWVNDAS